MPEGTGDAQIGPRSRGLWHRGRDSAQPLADLTRFAGKGGLYSLALCLRRHAVLLEADRCRDDDRCNEQTTASECPGEEGACSAAFVPRCGFFKDH